MTNDGGALELLVRQIEELLLPAGCSVTGNYKLYDDGIQQAEFDVVVEGRLGSTYFKWLIECRDRPADGPAPGSWIEQLAGRRDRFKFNKVTAVSSTGFADGAIKYGEESGIELRTVEDLRRETVASWLQAQSITFLQRTTKLTSAQLLVGEGEAESTRRALEKTLPTFRADSKILLCSDSGQLMSIDDAFLDAVLRQEMFEKVSPNGPRLPAKFKARYTNDDSHYQIEVEKKWIRVECIRFEGELYITQAMVPIGELKEYRRNEDGSVISQSAVVPVQASGQVFALEFHHLKETGETHVVVRSVRPALAA